MKWHSKFIWTFKQKRRNYKLIHQFFKPNQWFNQLIDQLMKLIRPLNPFYATGLFLYPLKTLENRRFSYVFRGYRKIPVAWNRLIKWSIDLEANSTTWWFYAAIQNLMQWLLILNFDSDFAPLIIFVRIFNWVVEGSYISVM